MKNIITTVLASICLIGTVSAQVVVPPFQKFRARYNFDPAHLMQTQGSLMQSTSDVISSYNEDNFVIAADYSCQFPTPNSPTDRTNEQVIKVFEIDEIGDIVDQTALVISGSKNALNYPAVEYNKIVRIIKAESISDEGYYVLYNFTRNDNNGQRFGLIKLDVNLDLVWHKPYELSSIDNVNVSGDDYEMRGLQILDITEHERISILFELNDGSEPMLGIFEVDITDGRYINTQLIKMQDPIWEFQIFEDYAADFIMPGVEIHKYVIACTIINTSNGKKEAALIEANVVLNTATTRLIDLPAENDVEIAALTKLTVTYHNASPPYTMSNYYLAGTAIKNANESEGLIIEVPTSIFAGPGPVPVAYGTYTNGTSKRAGFHEIRKSVGVQGTGQYAAVYAIGRMYDDALNMRSFMAGTQEGDNLSKWNNQTLFDTQFMLEYELMENNMLGFHATGNQNALSQACVGRIDNDVHVQKTGLHTNFQMDGFEISNCNDDGMDHTCGVFKDEGMSLENYNIMHVTADPELGILETELPFKRLDKCFEEVPQQTLPLINTGITCNETSSGAIPNATALENPIKGLNNIVLYPAITSGPISIRSESPIKVICIYDLSGHLVNTIQNSNNHEIEMNLSALPRGSYLVNVQTEDSNQVFKIMKQ